MKEKYRIICIDGKTGIVGRIMANDESVLDKYSYWHKDLKRRFEVMATINFLLKGLPQIKNSL